MNKVIFTFKGGQQRAMTVREAELFSRAGRGSYLTRDMQAAEAPAAHLAPQPAGDDLDALDADALHSLAKDRGLKVHPRAGAEKVRAALREGGK